MILSNIHHFKPSLKCSGTYIVSKNYFQGLYIVPKNFQGVYKVPKNYFQGVYKISKNFQGLYIVPKNFQGASK